MDHAYLAVSSTSFVAAHREQFYVSVSRGRHQVRVFTDDPEGLLESVRQTGSRLSAVELVQAPPPLRITPLLQNHVAPKNHLH
ncbi:MAG: hypothetical protein IPK15_21515 [Verrucomicrobia bacterium]|nr:hypothetical protein [Verrucomicrobiota bacterium]